MERPSSSLPANTTADQTLTKPGGGQNGKKNKKNKKRKFTRIIHRDPSPPPSPRTLARERAIEDGEWPEIPITYLNPKIEVRALPFIRARAPFPPLPLDISRMIFESVVLQSSCGRDAGSLLFVSKLVHAWTKPLIYHTPFSDCSDEDLDAFYHGVKNATDAHREFVAKHVKVLHLTKPEPWNRKRDFVLDMITFCPNIDTLLLGPECFIDDPRMLSKRARSIQHLSMFIDQDDDEVDYNLTLFRNLTQLTICLSDGDALDEGYDVCFAKLHGRNNFVNLTHLCVHVVGHETHPGAVEELAANIMPRMPSSLKVLLIVVDNLGVHEYDDFDPDTTFMRFAAGELDRRLVLGLRDGQIAAKLESQVVVFPEGSGLSSFYHRIGGDSMNWSRSKPVRELEKWERAEKVIRNRSSPLAERT